MKAPKAKGRVKEQKEKGCIVLSAQKLLYSEMKSLSSRRGKIV